MPEACSFGLLTANADGYLEGSTVYDGSSFVEIFMKPVKKFKVNIVKHDSDKRYPYVDIYTNPVRNSFKLLGYPDYFEEFFSFFRDNIDLIMYFDFIADVDDDCGFVFRGNRYEEGTFELKMFRNETIKDEESFLRWHEEFINSLKIYKEDT